MLCCTGVNKATSHAGYSGSGYVTGFDTEDDNITFSFEATGGLYDLFIGFCTPNGQKGYDLMVNGSDSTGMLPASESFKEVQAGKVMLVNGPNTIIIGNGWGWYYVDYIRLSAGSHLSAGTTAAGPFGYTCYRRCEEIISVAERIVRE